MSEGIPNGTWDNWIQRGRKERAEGLEGTIFTALLLAVEKSQAEAEVLLAQKGQDLGTAGKNTWMQPYRHLESFSRERWQKTERLEVSATVEHVDIPPDPPRDLAGWLERQQLQRNAVDAEYRVEPE